jgi:hypothetical protein
MRLKRRIQQPVHEVFRDGFLQYGYDTPKRNERGKRVGEDFVPSGKLAFKELTARDQDYEMAGASSSSLDLKLKTYRPPSFRNVTKSNMKCVIDGIKYDVIKVDGDNQKRYLYFYLQKVGVLNEREEQVENGEATTSNL